MTAGWSKRSWWMLEAGRSAGRGQVMLAIAPLARSSGAPGRQAARVSGVSHAILRYQVALGEREVARG